MNKFLTGKNVTWILRIAVFGEFLGHGMFALGLKEQWLGWVIKLLGVDRGMAGNMLMVVGTFDVIVAIIVLVKPIKPILLWAAFWGLFTALLRPIVGEPFWDFVERWANWGAPLALLYFIKES